MPERGRGRRSTRTGGRGRGRGSASVGGGKRKAARGGRSKTTTRRNKTAPETGCDSKDGNVLDISPGYDSQDEKADSEYENVLDINPEVNCYNDLSEEYQVTPEEAAKQRKEAIIEANKVAKQMEKEIKTFISGSIGKHVRGWRKMKEKDIIQELRTKCGHNSSVYGRLIVEYMDKRIVALGRVFLVLTGITPVWDNKIAAKVLEITERFQKKFFVEVEGLKMIVSMAKAALRESNASCEKELVVKALGHDGVFKWLVKSMHRNQVIEHCLQDQEEGFKSCIMANLKCLKAPYNGFVCNLGFGPSL